MIEVRQTETYAAWFANLRDRTARARINIRLRRLSLGNYGDVKPVGVYFVQRGKSVVVLLAAGDKGTQSRDIATALELAQEL